MGGRRPKSIGRRGAEGRIAYGHSLIMLIRDGWWRRREEGKNLNENGIKRRDKLREEANNNNKIVLSKGDKNHLR